MKPALRAFGLGPANGAEILQRMAASHRLYPEDDLGCRLQCRRAAPGQYRLAYRRPGLPAPLSEAGTVGRDDRRRRSRRGISTWPKAKPAAGSDRQPRVVNRLFSLPPLSATEAAGGRRGAVRTRARPAAAGRGCQRPPAPGRCAAHSGAATGNPAHPRPPRLAQLSAEFQRRRVRRRPGHLPLWRCRHPPRGKEEFITLPKARPSVCSAAPRRKPKPWRAGQQWPQKIPRHPCTPSAARRRASSRPGRRSHWVPFM